MQFFIRRFREAGVGVGAESLLNMPPRINGEPVTRNSPQVPAAAVLVDWNRSVKAARFNAELLDGLPKL